MSTQTLYEILKKSIDDTLDNLPENVTVTQRSLSNIVNQIIKEKFTDVNNPNSYLKLSVLDKFAGRGNAWVKINHGSPLYDRVINLLDVDSDSSDFYQYTSYKDIFEDNKFCWARYAGISDTKGVQFHVRVYGSKNIEHIKLYTDLNTAYNLDMLEGVPHKLGLETGDKIIQNKKTISKDDPIQGSNDFFSCIDDLI